MTREELFSSKWLRASDIAAPISVTVECCTVENIGQGEDAERKPVLHFRGGTLRPFVLNVTNFEEMSTITGYPDCDDWGGTPIELLVHDVLGSNGPTRRIRIGCPGAYDVEEIASRSPLRTKVGRRS